MTLSARIFCGALVLVFTACSKNNSSVDSNVSRALAPQAIAQYHVAETFNVGDNTVVRALATDSRNKRLWVGSSVGVIEAEITTGNVIKTYTRENGLANEYVFSVLVDSRNNKWFGTNGGGVSRLDSQGQWRTFFPMHGLADYWVYSFAERGDGSLWIGTWAGLSVLDPVSNQMRTYLKELVNEWVYGLVIDQHNTVWVGTEGGVNSFDGTQWRTWTHADGLGAANVEGLPFSDNTGLGTRARHDLSVLLDGKETYNPNYVFCLNVDEKNRIWAGTWGGGVSRYDGVKWQNFTTREGLAGNIVYSMAQDASGGFWFGTNHGVSFYDGTQWQNLSANDGLLDNHVYALTVDGNGNIWAGTRRGVARISRS